MAEIPTPEAHYISKNGYVTWKVNGKWQSAARVVMEAMLDRDLLPGERVHFNDGNKENLDPENLRLVYPGSRSKAGRIAFLEQTFEQSWKEMYELDSERAGEFAKNLLLETLRWFA
jgi:hypothetical protein